MGFKICEILGVEVNEQFTLPFNNVKYHVNLLGFVVDEANQLMNQVTLLSLINEKYKIVKIPKPNYEEQECLDFYSKHGRHWFAKDRTGLCYAYYNKPNKDTTQGWWMSPNEHSLQLPCDLKFLSWEDEEPYHCEGEVS